MHIKLIFTRKVVHLALFWKWGFLELASGLLFINQFQLQKAQKGSTWQTESVSQRAGCRQLNE